MSKCLIPKVHNTCQCLLISGAEKRYTSKTRMIKRKINGISVFKTEVHYKVVAKARKKLHSYIEADFGYSYGGTMQIFKAL